MKLTRGESAAAFNLGAPLDTPLRDVAPKRARTYPEADLQRTCIAHYRARVRVDPVLRAWTRLFAVNPLSQKLTPWQRQFSKAMGSLPGVFDLQLLDQRTTKFVYTWIEMKSPDGRYTPEQKDFAEWLDATPVRCVVCRSLDEFLAVIA